MKRLSVILTLLVLPTACFGNPATGSLQDDRGRPVLQLGNNKIEINHGRPGLRNRNPEAMIQPGQVWRMGANDPTTLTTQASLKFGEKAVPAGQYVLQAKFDQAKKWHLLIQADGGTTIAEVPFTLQRLEKPVEYLTIILEKKDKGGRLILQWGTMSLAADFQPAGTTAAAESSDKWNELSAFHEVMSATFHPMEEGDLKPIRGRAGEMAEKAMQWADSTPPKIYTQTRIKENVAKLATESKALATLVARNGSDAQIKEALNALHDRFHEIAGMCRDAKKQQQ